VTKHYLYSKSPFKSGRKINFLRQSPIYFEVKNKTKKKKEEVEYLLSAIVE
jgi:hypothetical protein